MDRKEFEQDLRKKQDATITAAADSVRKSERSAETLACVYAILSGFCADDIYCNVLDIRGQMRNVKDFSAVTPVFEALSLIGVPITGWKSIDYPAGLNRDFSVDFKGIHIVVELYADKENSNCRVVEDGVETHTKHRLECGDDDSERPL